jgi:hypothetical protein
MIMSSSDRVTAQLAAQKAAKDAAAKFAADNARRANPQPHKVDKSVLRVKEGRGRR